MSYEMQLASLQSEHNTMKSQYDKIYKEKEQMLIMMQDGQNNDAFDAFKFKNMQDENKEYLKIIEDLKFELASEKNLSQETMLNAEDLLSKISVLNEENNRLQNLKNDLINQLNSQKQLFDIRVKELQDSE